MNIDILIESSLTNPPRRAYDVEGVLTVSIPYSTTVAARCLQEAGDKAGDQVHEALRELIYEYLSSRPIQADIEWENNDVERIVSVQSRYGEDDECCGCGCYR